MRLISDDTWAILTIAGEAGNQPQAGKVAVAEVIRNRTNSKYSSDGSVASTVLRPLQFSVWNALASNRVGICKLEIAVSGLYADCASAWRTAQDGSDTTHGAVLYFNPAIVGTPKWATVAEHTATIGAHQFYKPKAPQ